MCGVVSRYDQTCYWDPALLPKINYVSMMLDKDSSVDGSMTDELAMKYLNDEQLTELQRVCRHSPDKAGGVDMLMAQTPSTPNKKHMSFASKKYLERYGLWENDSDGEASPQKHFAVPSSRESYRTESTHSTTSNDHRPVRRSLEPREQSPEQILNLEEIHKLPKLT